MGYHIVFHLQLQEAKGQIKTYLQSSSKNKDIIELAFSKEETKNLEWENDHEFLFKNEMYDVIEKKISHGKLIIRCISDKKETALLDQYRKANNSNHSTSLLKLISTHFLAISNEVAPPPSKVYKTYHFLYASTLHSRSVLIDTPPPKVC